MSSRIPLVPLVLLGLAFSSPLLPTQENVQSSSQKIGNGSVVPHNSPNSPEAREALAKAQELMFKQHDAKASIEYFKKVVELDPAFLQGHILLGNAYMQIGQWAEAQSSFEKAARLEPLSSVALLGIGAALNQQL